jgi:alcohol dehydrogenase, propanol-preferring
VRISYRATDREAIDPRERPSPLKTGSAPAGRRRPSDGMRRGAGNSKCEPAYGWAMRAMILHGARDVATIPLTPEKVDDPTAVGSEVRVRVEACGVCRTDLHVVEGDLPMRLSAVIPGHEIVGRVDQVGPEVRNYQKGDRVGIPWLRRTCGRCEYCTTGRENLCAAKEFTGYTAHGGYAEYAVADEAFVFPLPAGAAAPLAPFLCAGIIGYRALKLALPRPGGRIGFFGFGGSAHLTLQLASRMGYETVAYSRSPEHRELATRLGASETVSTELGGRVTRPPSLDGAVVFSPAGASVRDALAEMKKGALLSIAAIHMSPIPKLDYDRYLFGERRVMSVEANTRQDAREFLELAARLHLESTVETRPLLEANQALQDLKEGRVVGALALDPNPP